MTDDVATSAFDPVIDGLREPWHEVQLGRVLVRIASEADAARMLAELLLDIATVSGSRPEVAAAFQARSLPLSADVRCVDEAELLSREGFIVRRRRIRTRGYVDLRLTDDADFDLWVELKQKSSTGLQQVPDYVRLSGGAVILIANRQVDEPTLAHNDNWLGTVLWKDLIPKLDRLSDLPSWTSFLGVLKAELGVSSPYAERWRAALHDTRHELIDHVRSLLRARTDVGDVARLAGWDSKGVRKIADGGWIRLRVPAADHDDTAMIAIEVKGRTRSPRVRVYYLPRMPLVRAPRRVEPFERLPPDPSAAEIAAVAREGLAHFIEPGLLDADARRAR